MWNNNLIKNITFAFTIAAASLGFTTSADAKIMKSNNESVIEVIGKLTVEHNQKNFVAKIETNGGEILKLQNVHLPWSSCQLGEYSLEYLRAGELADEAGWFLVEVNECFDHIFQPQRDKNQWFCPEIYEPVCAQPAMNTCAPGTFCSQVMPAPRSYDNPCQMWLHGAEFMNFGSCDYDKEYRY